MSKEQNALFTELTSYIFNAYPELDRNIFNATIDEDGSLTITSYYNEDLTRLRENDDDPCGIYYYFANIAWVKVNPDLKLYNYYKIKISWDEAFLTSDVDDFFDNCDYNSIIKDTNTIERLKKHFLNNFSKFYEFFKNEYSPVYKLALAEDIRHKRELKKINDMLKFKVSL